MVQLLMFHPIRWLLQQASAQGSRSTVLRPLGWLISICAAAALSAVLSKAPGWLTILFSVGFGIGILLYLFAYMFCLFKDRDALRSETYSIQRLAIEKGFIGDTLAGTFRLDAGEPPAAAIERKRAGEADQ